jgi:thymidylate synthase ThyX
MINAELILATRPQGTGPGLATFVVEVPAYVWMELLTHKRFARNASSARAQSHQRHAAMGYHVPPQWYRQGTWMSPGLPLDPASNDYVTRLVEEYYAECERRIAAIMIVSNGGIAKEQINRLMPISRMMRGVMTGTESAWCAMLELRNHATADVAMRAAAEIIAQQLDAADWKISNEHTPFGDDAMTAAARIARVSAGAPGAGQRSDLDLAHDLIKQRHLSPFEHCATWVSHPAPSALCSTESDKHEDHGWENHRVLLETTL